MSAGLPKPGELFDARYRIEAAIGRGGFGCVYRARDEKLGRPVALKVLAPDAGGDDRLRRFWREADLSRRLVHPHTVRVYDFGLESQALPYIAFELLDGESLQRRLTRVTTLSVPETRRIASSVLKALMEAHALGIVHRDIKPANVYLCGYAGESDFVKVLDFGIAKAATQRDLTVHGWLVGTPIYMAPEQIVGRDLTPRADLYSLGLLMCTMLTGNPLLSGSAPEIIAQQLSDEPLQLPPEVIASPLFAVIRRATEKDPERRYASAAEMLGDLDGTAPVVPTLFDEPALRVAQPASVAPVAYAVSPSSPPPPPPLRASASRLPIVALALLTALLLIAGAGTLLIIAQPKRAELRAGISMADPSGAPELVKLRAVRAGFVFGAERRLSPAVVDREFSHPLALGVVRFEEHGTPAAARIAEREAGSDATRASIRRGRRVVSVWAAPRGHTSFDRTLADRLLASLVPAGG